MALNRNKRQIDRARRLRKDMTDGEKKLWRALQDFRPNHEIHARKQVPIGPYVVDFAILKHKMVIEVDGEFHFTETGMRRDSLRDAYLAEMGYRVLRINTGELAENFDGCVATILRELSIA